MVRRCRSIAPDPAESAGAALCQRSSLRNLLVRDSVIHAPRRYLLAGEPYAESHFFSNRVPEPEIVPNLITERAWILREMA
jgi:hypothetical protein